MSKQEIKPCKFANGACIHCQATEKNDCEGWVCPPQRQWVGLTEEDRCKFAAAQYGWEDLCLAVEAKLKEKNHG